MTTPSDPLDAVRNWYLATKEVAKVLTRLGGRYWDALPDDHPISQDETFKKYKTGAELVGKAEKVVAAEVLDDAAVLLLFAAFEGELRTLVALDVRDELARLPAKSLLRHTLGDLQQRAERGSVAALIEHYGPVDPELVGRVKELRQYRNGLVHGRHPLRRGHPQPTPEAVHTLLSKLLTVITARRSAAPPGVTT